MARPRVDVVVPSSGGPDALKELRARLSRLRLQDSDTIVVVDHTPGREPEGASGGGVPVLAASARATPGYARNCGAELGSGEWLVFLDADTEPPADLLDRYFDPGPGARTALIGGGVIDRPPSSTSTARRSVGCSGRRRRGAPGARGSTDLPRIDATTPRSRPGVVGPA